jgi:hypothetical protein
MLCPGVSGDVSESSALELRSTVVSNEPSGFRSIGPGGQTLAADQDP